mmetsp:Transcript_15758/g.49346  ORF Transcript_15758/g.49346 Transcript_15758/m.49346 type:complete len:259 (+) Transcript_15758:654-1430(+)
MCRPRMQNSPSPSKSPRSGLWSTRISHPSRLGPHVPNLKPPLSDNIIETDCGPVFSDIPYSSMTGMPMDAKYLSVSDETGAAPVKRRMHRSRPRAFGTALRTRLDTVEPHGTVLSSEPASRASIVSSTLPLAHPLMDCTKPGLDAAMSWMAAASFSQTRGTPKKTVGRTRTSVSLSDPLSASGRAKCTVPLHPMYLTTWMGMTMSNTCAAMCESGKKDTMWWSLSRGRPTCVISAFAVHVALSWLIITALGVPVVPEV